MVITLGPEGTFSSVVARKIFPKEKVVYEQNFYSIFQHLMTKGGKAVLPLENSAQGTVKEVWNFLRESDFKIWHTLKLPIHYALAAQKKNFIRIASHPQALGQCRASLQHSYAAKEIVPAASTAQAILLAEEDSAYAAIASPTALRESSLKILKKDLKVNKKNSTLFGVIAKKSILAKKRKGLMSIVINPKVDRPGLLFDILKPFKDNHVNLTRVESQAAGKALGQYVFFLDLRGKKNDPKIKKAFKDLDVPANIKIIGEY